MPKKLTTEEFIQKANQIHNNKYDYSKVVYVNNHTKICIICPEHGEFWQTPNNHLRNRKCPICDKEKYLYTPKKKLSDVILDFQKIHGQKYDYSLITKENYKNSKSKIPIICLIHGIFNQTVNNHYMGNECPKCKIKEKSFKKRKPIQQLIKKFIKIHNNKYNYSLISDENYKNCNSKIPIICKKHGLFYQIVYVHSSGCGCPTCKQSKGEKEIEKWLIENNIDFILQFRFKDCKNILPLPFDFYIPELNICIEYDGKQHFQPIKRWGGISKFQKTKKNDKIKNQYCKKNNIKLIRIKFLKNINQILSKQLFK